MDKSIVDNNEVVFANCEEAIELAKSLGLATVTELPADKKLYLAYYNQHLCLCENDKKNTIKISVDFVSSQLAFRQQRISLKSEPMLRAIGCSQKRTLSVLDATAGLGRDSFLMASYNCDVTMLESSRLVAALLEDGLVRARLVDDISDIVLNMRLVKQNAIDYLQRESSAFDVVYLDPMFPPRSKTAKVKKEMQLLHRLLGASLPEDDEALLSIAFEKVLGRVVVKRPKSADYLANKKPSYSLNTKAMRYDVYVKKPLD